MTRTIYYSLLATAVLTLSPLAFAAERGTLLPASAGDLVVSTLSTHKRAPVAPVESQPVHFAWAIPADSTLEAIAPHVAESREFWSLHSPEQLAEGVRFAVGSPGALIRLSPVDATKARGDTEFVLRHDGRPISEGKGILRTATAEQVKALGADFGIGSRVLQLDPALGAGHIELASTAAGGRWLVHVLEPDSDQVLILSTDRHVAAAGGRIGVYVDWRDGERSIAPALVRGVITAPDGSAHDVSFQRDAAGRWFADAEVPHAAAMPGLWEVHTFAAADRDGMQLLRDAKTAFAIGERSARLAGDYAVTHGADALSLAISVEAASEGRYELRGTLHGTDADGRLVPFAVAHAAEVLPAGSGRIALQVPADLIKAAGVSAPFELRDLALSNQGTLSRIETRAVAARIDAVDAAAAHAPGQQQQQR